MDTAELLKDTPTQSYDWNQLMMFASLKRSIINDLLNNKNESVVYSRYNRADVIQWLQAPQRNEDKIRELSNFLYIVSSNYHRLIDYFSEILLYHYNVIPVDREGDIDPDQFGEDYLTVIRACGKYNLKHEAMKMIKVAIRDGVFFGICYESKDSFFIKHVPTKYAKINSILDGVYTFEFDLNYFTSHKELLVMYGAEFEKAYELYKGNQEKGIIGDKTLRWYEPKNGICVKVDESDPYYSLPLFTGLITSIFDIDDYKMLQKAKAENDNYKALALKVPTDSDGVPLLEYEQNERYWKHVVANVDNEGIGVFMTPFAVSDFSFANTETSDMNGVVDAENEFWAGAGVSSLIFGSQKATSSAALTLSVKPDEQIAYSLLLQIQRFFNRKIKKMNLKNLFKINFLNSSIFNRDEVSNRLQKAAAYGVPVKMEYLASLGYEPIDTIGMTYLEEQILGLSRDTWTSPLVSSSVQSSVDNEGGRPTNESQGVGLTESGEQTAEDDENASR